MTAAVGRRRVAVERVPAALLAVLAEGAWIAVPYALIQASRGEAFVVGPLGFAAFATVGLVAAVVLAPRFGEGWPGIALVLVVVAAIAGWLLDDLVRSELAAGDAGDAIQRHQAGFLAGLAFLRGMPHAQLATSERALTRALTWVTPLLAIPLLLGRAIDEPARSAFERGALVDCLVFLLAGTLGLALIRVERLGRIGGFDWSRNRVWILCAVVVALVAVVALPLAYIAGPTVRLIVALGLPPLLLVALVASVSQITVRTIGIVAAVGLVVFAVSRLNLFFEPNLAPGTPSPTLPGPNGQDPAATVLTWLPIIALLAVALIVLLRRWMRRRPIQVPAGVAEERWTEHPESGAGRLPRLRLPWLRRSRAAAPVTGVEAYLAALDDLGREPALARRTNETPAAHSRRLRNGDAGLLALDLLAADYQLSVFAAKPLTAAENRRAVGRWRRLRDRPWPARGSSDDAPAAPGSRSSSRSGTRY